MTILGCADNDNFKIACQFCFLKLADLKRHLRDDHEVDTRGVEGNNLYARFKIRATDGLLQRWLMTSGGQAKQGDMMKYWNHGSNQLFLQLVDLMKRSRLSERQADEPNLSDERKERIEEFLSEGRSWFEECARTAHDRWRALKAPFERSSENIKDFIALDDEVEEEEDSELLHSQLSRKMAADDVESDPNGFVAKIQRKYADDEDVESNDESDNGENEAESEEDLDKKEEEEEEENEEGNDDDNDPTLHDGAYSEVEEETDDWVKSKLNYRKRKSSITAQNDSNSPTSESTVVVGKRLTKRRSPTASTPQQPPRAPVIRRTPGIQDSSDED